MNQFVIGVILVIIASWFCTSAYMDYTTISKFTEIQQTLFNAKIVIGGFTQGVAMFLQFYGCENEKS